MTMLVTGSLASSAIAYSSWNYGSTKRSDADSQARALAEAGLNYAFSTLYNSGTPTMGNAVPSRTITLETGDASYYGTLTGSTWKLVGVGTVRKPTGPGSEPVVRTVSGRASIGTAQHGSDNNAVWNYVYVDDPTFTTDLGNSVDINIPLYTRGNLRLSNSSQVSGYALQTMGWLELNNTAHVGTAGAKIHEAHIAGGCRLGAGGALVSPCGPSQRVYADISDATTTNFSKPPVDLNGWYFNAQPGPRHACTSGSFPGGFDNDATPNNSRGAGRPAPEHELRLPRLRRGRRARGPADLGCDGTHPDDARHDLLRRADPVPQSQLGGLCRSRHDLRRGQHHLRELDHALRRSGVRRGLEPAAEPARVRLRRQRLDGQLDPLPGCDLCRRTTTPRPTARPCWGPIIARRVSFANSSVNHYVPIGTLMPGMPATYEDVVTITNEPGSWG